MVLRILRISANPGWCLLALLGCILSEPATISTDGSGKARLTTEVENFIHAWSPDGRRIAFVACGGGSWAHDCEVNLWVMDADGSNPLRLTDSGGSEYDLLWSEDGGRIRFKHEVHKWSLSCPERYEVREINVDGTGETRLPGGPWCRTSEPGIGPTIFRHSLGEQLDD